ncbi:MAG: biopolymer transporter ExbD [Polyangiaceae bacterium]
MFSPRRGHLLLASALLGCSSETEWHGDQGASSARAAASTTTSSSEPWVAVSSAPAPPAPPRSADPLAKASLVVDIDRAGKLKVNGRALAADAELEALARAAIATNPAIAATLRSDPNVPHSRIIEVIDALRTAGIREFNFAVDAPKP